MATTLASGGVWRTASGSVVNDSFHKIALPEMTAFGYDRRLSAGCICASGTLASLIPPSIIMVIYAILTEQSVALLLMAGLVPGLLSGAMYMGGIYTIAKIRPDMALSQRSL